MRRLEKGCGQKELKQTFKDKMRVVRTVRGVSQQMSHEGLQHYVVREVTKLQSYRSNNYFFVLTKNHRKNVLKRTIVSENQGIISFL